MPDAVVGTAATALTAAPAVIVAGRVVGATTVDQITVGLSTATDTIPGIAALHNAARAGDENAGLILREARRGSPRYLFGTRSGVTIDIDDTTGVFDGDVEPSLGLRVTFENEADRAFTLAALDRFATAYNQRAIHVTKDVDAADVGTKYDDGSYATPSYKVGVNRKLSAKEIEDLRKRSGLYGMTYSEKTGTLEIYYVGDTKDTAAIAEFERNVGKLQDNITARRNAREAHGVIRLIWVYGEGGIPFERIRGDVSVAQAEESNETARLIAERISGFGVTPAPQADVITSAKRSLQQRLARAYDEM